MKTTVDVGTVTRVGAGAPSPKAPRDAGRAVRRVPARAAAPSGTATSATGPSATAIRTGDLTCDVRGLRVDEALERVDAFIDRLLIGGESAGFVLHGHGTGALKLAVREHLARCPHIDRSEPAAREEGGDALSVFWLR